MRPGPRNLITDIDGLYVGNAEHHGIKTGVTVLVGDKPFIASVDVMGGSPGTRETDLLDPDRMVESIDALVLSGGSAFGLDAASGVVDGLVKKGRGFTIGPATIPIVPAAIIFDLINGGDKSWGENPYREMGAQALENADVDFALGTAGAGTGALTAGLKGGLGSASLILESGVTVGALIAANPTGTVTMGDGPHFWANSFEIDAEFGGLGAPADRISQAQAAMTKRHLVDDFGPSNTAIAIVATDAKLTKAQAKRMAVAAQDGIARAISPSHTPVDGDLVFAVSTGVRPLGDPIVDAIDIGHAAAVCLSRAVARSVYLASAAPGDVMPSWRQKFAAG